MDLTIGIVTNGYLLNEKIISSLKDFKVEYIQITADGPPHIHNRRKILKSGKGTFDIIYKNLVKAGEHFPVFVRVNLDRENYPYINELLEYFKNTPSSIKLYPARAAHIWNEKFKNEKEFTREEFAKVMREFYIKCIENKINYDFVFLVMREAYCVASFINGFVINYDGGLYKCWEDLDTDESMKRFKLGDVWKGVTNTSLYIKWILSSPFNHQKCINCVLLPSCMGGCPAVIVKSHKFLCDYDKFSVEEYIKLLSLEGRGNSEKKDM